MFINFNQVQFVNSAVLFLGQIEGVLWYVVCNYWTSFYMISCFVADKYSSWVNMEAILPEFL